jgi:hypothetical protein
MENLVLIALHGCISHFGFKNSSGANKMDNYFRQFPNAK